MSVEDAVVACDGLEVETILRMALYPTSNKENRVKTKG